MNDDTDKPLNPVGDAALEARITAWVLGEASPFEAAELEEICARDPEARLFERRLRVLHGFITEDREAGPDDEWKLSAEKRAKIEALFDEAPVVLGEEDREAERVGIRYVRKPQAPRQTGRRALMALAACTVISAAGWMLFSSVGESSRDVVALQAEANVAAKKATREAQQRYLEELRKAVLVQEDAVEDKRKLLSQIEWTESFRNSEAQAARGSTTGKSVAEAHAEVAKEKAELEGQLAVLDYATARPQMSYGSGWVIPDEELAAKVPQVQEETRQFDALRSQGLAENHPAVKAKAAKVGEMEKDLKESVAKVRQTLEARLALSNEQLARLDSRMKEREADAVKAGIANQTFMDPKNDFESSQRLLEQLKLKLISEEMKMKLSDDATALASADQIGFLPGGGGGGAGGALPSDPYADMAPASPAVAAKPAAPMAVPSQQSAGEMDAFAAVGKKAGREQAVDESLAKLGDGPGSNMDANRIFASGGTVGEGQSRTNADFIGEIAGVTVPGIPADPGADVGDIMTAGNRSGQAAINRNSIDAILNNSDRKEADASLFGNKNALRLDADGRGSDGVDIAGNTKSQDKVIRREMTMKPQEWSGRSSTATPLADGFDLQARFKGDAPAADAKVLRLGGLLHEDTGGRYAWSPNDQGAKGTTEFSDLAGMADLAKTTPLGSSFDMQSRFRGEMPKVSRQMSLGGGLRYRDSLASGSEYNFGGEVSKGYNLELDVARGGLATDFADGFAANDRAPMEEKELGQSPAPGQSPGKDSEEVGLRLHLAEGNYKLGKFDDAHKVYEDVLRLDPYNKEARRGMEQVAQARSDYYRAAYDQTRAQLLTEVDGALKPAVPQAEEKGLKDLKNLGGDSSNEVRAQLLAEVDRAWELAVPPTNVLDAAKTAGSPEELMPRLETAIREEEEKLQQDPNSAEIQNQIHLLAKIREDLRGKIDAKAKEAETQEKAPESVALTETLTSAEPFSTFSLHVSDASFKMAKAALDRGEVAAADGIRPEEFYNAFDYGDPAPANGEPVVCAVEQSAHPALPQRNLLRVGVKTGSQGRGGSTPLNLTLLLDSSGSMEREDRNAGLANAVQQLSGLLKEGDTVSVIGFARQPRLLVDRLPGNRAQELNAIFEQTPSEGGTNLEEGLKLGEELALRQFNAAAQNRIVLFTDGAANLGDAKPETLQAKVEQMRQKGIAFDAAGFGTDGLNDKLLERLTRNGNGRYYIVDRAEDADASFAKQLAGAFRPAAENVKVQVRFNPARVAKYKLIGFEEHRLNKEDFRNDAVDAAEMAAEEAGNALYQIEALPQGEGEVGEVSVRFRDVASGQMVERTWTIPYESQTPAFDQATPSIQLAGLAAFAAEKLRGTPMADAVDFQQLAPVMAKVKARYATSKPVADLESMIGRLK